MGLHVVLVSFPTAAAVKDPITDRTFVGVVITVVEGHPLKKNFIHCESIEYGMVETELPQ